jgi:FUS-interacting serine-arginine-rich protein 1
MRNFASFFFFSILLDMGPRDFHRDGPRNGYRDGPRDGYGGPPEYHNGPPGPYGPYDGPPRGAGERGERRRRDEGPPGVSLLVRNLPNDIQAQDLQNAFGRIGVIRDVYIPRDFHSQQPKGFAFIEYASPDMAREARSEMDKFVIKGSQLEVVFAQERRKTPNEMRGRVADAHSRRSPEPGERGGGGGFERYVVGKWQDEPCDISVLMPYIDAFFSSSSFERHRQKKRERRDNDCPPVKREDDAPPKGDQEGPH